MRWEAQGGADMTGLPSQGTWVPFFFWTKGRLEEKKGTPKSLLVCGLFLVFCGWTHKPGALLRVGRTDMGGSRHGGDVYCCWN